MKYFYILLTFISLSSLAQVKIQVVDPELDTTPLEGRSYQIEREEKSFSSIPAKEKRDKLLADVPESKLWDELDKDIFYMDLKNQTIEQLVAKYPKMTKTKLERLKFYAK